MTEHFTKLTVSAEFHCPKCDKRTQHRIDSGRKGPCLECMARYDAAPKGEKVEVEVQKSLFGDAA